MTRAMPEYSVTFPFDVPYNCIRTMYARMFRTQSAYRNDPRMSHVPDYWFGQDYSQPQAYFNARPHLLFVGLVAVREFVYGGESLYVVNIYTGNPDPNVAYQGWEEPDYDEFAGGGPFLWDKDHHRRRELSIMNEVSPTLGDNYPGLETAKNCLIGRKIWFKECGYGAVITDVNFGKWNDDDLLYSYFDIDNIQYLGSDKATWGGALANLEVGISDRWPFHTYGWQWWGWLGGTSAPVVKNLGYSMGPILSGDATLLFDIDVYVRTYLAPDDALVISVGYATQGEPYAGYNDWWYPYEGKPAIFPGTTTYNPDGSVKYAGDPCLRYTYTMARSSTIASGAYAGLIDLHYHINEMFGGWSFDCVFSNPRWVDINGAPYSPDGYIPGGSQRHTIEIVPEPAWF